MFTEAWAPHALLPNNCPYLLHYQPDAQEEFSTRMCGRCHISGSSLLPFGRQSASLDPFVQFGSVYLIARHSEHGTDVAQMLLRTAFAVVFQPQSASGMQEYARYLSRDLDFSPIRVLRSQPGRFQFPGGPVKLLCQCQTSPGWHSPEGFYLLWTGLFIRQHGSTMRPWGYPSKLFAFANASSSLLTSLPPPLALSGRPPPFPPTMGAMV